MIPSNFRMAVKRTGILLVAYSICRMFHLFWNWQIYSHLPASDLVWAFIIGFRFDLSAILLTLSPLLIFWLMPDRLLQSKWIQRIEFSLYVAILWITLGSNFVDAEFVKFIGKRSSYDLLFLQQDIEQQSLSLVLSYWYICLTLTLFVALLAWLSPRVQKAKGSSDWRIGLAWRVVLVGLFVLGARGGWQLKPLHPMHAYFSTRHELGTLALNTPFNVIKTRPHTQVEHHRYFKTDQEAASHVENMTQLSRPSLGLAPNFNVVVLIVESLGSENVGAANNFPGYTPFLDQLAKESLFYRFNMANGRRSIEGLPAVICGLPAIMAQPVITSEFSNNQYNCLPHVLGRLGYNTYFLHGAHNGSMHFDTFSHIAGFENFVGLNEFPHKSKENLDETWGVLDEPMLQYAAEVLDHSQKPTFLSVFTLSSHHPYYIPPQYRGKFPKGPLEIQESLGYADLAIRKFFETARTRPWFNKTIFVITGDHTQKFYTKEYTHFIGWYRVPLFVYAPGLDRSKLPYDPSRVTQQIDIPPTILDLLGVEPSQRLLVGQSVLDLAKPGRAYSFNSPAYWYIDSKVYIQMSREGRLLVQEPASHAIPLPEYIPQPAEIEGAHDNLKAVVHYLNEGLVRNKLYSRSE
ncbi:MAG: LTA synthase family protein [Bdellovibrionales bacterium]